MHLQQKGGNQAIIAAVDWSWLERAVGQGQCTDGAVIASSLLLPSLSVDSKVEPVPAFARLNAALPVQAGSTGP